jgi:hypothetical protein
MPGCEAPIPDEMLLDYWTGDGAADHTDGIEAHLFECGDCAARLEHMASIGMGLAALVRRGHVSGVVSRTLVNRMQRDGLHVRLYSVSPGETLPCAVFPGDDLVVASLRADFSGVHAATLSVTGPGNSPLSEFDEIPVSRSAGEVLWALPGAVVHQMPSTRLKLTLTSRGTERAVLGEYVLEHLASDPPDR